MSANFFTVKQTAQHLAVSECWVRRHRNELGAIYLGRSVRFDPNVLSRKVSIKSPAIERPLKLEGGDLLQRTRWQEGTVTLYRGKRVKTWYGVYRVDQKTAGGGIVRKQKVVKLGDMQRATDQGRSQRRLRDVVDAAHGEGAVTRCCFRGWRSGSPRRSFR